MEANPKTRRERFGIGRIILVVSITLPYFGDNQFRRSQVGEPFRHGE